jgi:hypothetical protein
MALVSAVGTDVSTDKFIALMMEAARTSETSVDFQLKTRQYIPEDSELHTRRRENFKSHKFLHLYVRQWRQWEDETINYNTSEETIFKTWSSSYSLEFKIFLS